MSLLLEYPITIGCIVLLLTTFSMNYILDDASNKLGLVTVNTFIADTQIWNLITSQFYERKLIKLAFDIVGIIVITRSTKISKGKHFPLFFFLCILACSVFTSAYCFIRYFSTAIEEMIMAPIFGFSGVFMTMLTFSRQQLRSQPIFPQLPGITYNNLPILVIIAQMLLWLIGLKVFAVDLPFSIIAMLFSWSYLRFYFRYDEKFSSDGTCLGRTYGDNSEEFAFVGMFPEALHLVVIPMTTGVYNIFAMMGVVPEIAALQDKGPKMSHHLRVHMDPEPSDSSIRPESPRSKANAVQDRRRAKALKLLDAKMAQMSEEGIADIEEN